MKKNKLLRSVAIEVAGLLMVGGLTACDQTEIMVGMDGLSAYELAVENGYEGTLDDWLESAKTAVDQCQQ